jgi:glycosyltransferase involved in cell wall biosynthesis
VQVGLHGNLNEITGWRPRNPLTRRFDLASAISARHRPPLRFLVLEQVIKDELQRLSPLGAARTDVLPHPVNVAEIPESAGQRLGFPLRIGFVGQATQAKGFDVFLAIAREMKARHGDRITFHLIGRTVPGTDLGSLDALADPPSAAHLPRAEFTARLATIHYVLLPFRNGYYSLSASGGLIDAITWLKPVITTDVPLARYLFDQFGEIGFLRDDAEGLRRTVETVLAGMDQARYDRQVEALRRVRDSRRPAALASAYRRIVDDGFAGLLD